MLRPLAVLAFVAVVASPAAADRLVTLDGETITTRGEWRAEGKLIIFTASDGRLSSIRASEVDLAASRAAESPTPVVAEPEPPARKPVVMVMTDKDFRRARTPVAVQPEVEAAPAAAPAAAQPATVEILRHEDRMNFDANALEVFGAVKNSGSSVATRVTIEVRLLDRDGDLVESGVARLAHPALQPGQTTNFIASFSGSPGYESVDFNIESRGFSMRSEAPEPATEEPGS